MFSGDLQDTTCKRWPYHKSHKELDIHHRRPTCTLDKFDLYCSPCKLCKSSSARQGSGYCRRVLADPHNLDKSKRNHRKRSSHTSFAFLVFTAVLAHDLVAFLFATAHTAFLIALVPCYHGILATVAFFVIVVNVLVVWQHFKDLEIWKAMSFAL